MGSIRLRGILKKWFDDKGFGFIAAEKDNTDIFIHISAFDKDLSRRPKVGDTIFFYADVDKNGKTKAVDAVIEGVSSIERNKPKYSKHKSSSNRSGKELGKRLLLLCTVVTIGLAVTLYKGLQKTGGESPFTTSELSKIFKIPENINQSTVKYSCKGKTRCNQMRSCEEAMFYIRNCPGTKMDGDRDGIPCERQWCN